MGEFEEKNQRTIERMAADVSLRELTRVWFNAIQSYEYSYHFTWLGRPIIQFPQDVLAIQEIIWKVKPDLIVETGVAHGGSVIFSASMLELIGGDGIVVGIDIDIRPHNRAEIEKHPMFKRIELIQGSSIDQTVVDRVNSLAADKERVMVILDSNHTHEHVFRELELYSPLVKKESYLLVLDTVIEDMREDLVGDRPWGVGNSPRTAVNEFLKINDRFVVDKEIENKLLLTVAPHGYLRCIK
ncbi:MAG TPA: cephalosporin hydroxylase family protein [Pyrinomonadaceae bacterium]|nr:cephalosporin hydroxylase family protein [Pyrinomonadaceae bacterium]